MKNWPRFRVFLALVGLGGTPLFAEEAKPTAVFLNGKETRPTHGSVTGFWFYAEKEGPQAVLSGHPPKSATLALNQGDRVALRIPLPSVSAGSDVSVHARRMEGSSAEVRLRLGGTGSREVVSEGVDSATFHIAESDSLPAALCVEVVAAAGPTTFRLEALQLTSGRESKALALIPDRLSYTGKPVLSSPPMMPTIERTLVEWDWRMQDGIQTPQEPRTYAQAIEKIVPRLQSLLEELSADGVDVTAYRSAFAKLTEKRADLNRQEAASEAEWESLWLDIHRLRREAVFANPLADTGPLLFTKRVPSIMSHQLTQYYGYTARPGGGLFVLEEPGKSMRHRELTGSFPAGSFTRPEVSFDGATIYVGFCVCETAPEAWRDPAVMDRRYHLFRMDADGSGAAQITDGRFDDYFPVCLPNGKLLFVSTRRGGFHRCGGGPCFVYTLALAEADGSNPRPISFHETNEWDPSVLGDGRVIYTRWDYVDRNAVYYQQLWSVRQDGTDVRIFYGNNTFNPAGVWEARAVPGSNKVMATAAAHHAMTAGSIILLDVTRGVDGSEPITRLTPDALFSETEAPVMHGVAAPEPTDFDKETDRFWHATLDPDRRTDTPEEQKRWVGHCYRSAWPLSEKFFLCAYSYDRLRGEPGPNLPNLFGIYLVDAFGNKELVYRDPNLSSLWPMPLRPRPVPPETPSLRIVGAVPEEEPSYGTFLLKNVYESWPKLPDVPIKQLRIVQVLPKTTPNANQPKVGEANASPGKQVLGTVPVYEDGSAYFKAPARIGLSFQALDEKGRAVQTMRSLTYLQPGEVVSCVGCHERRTAVPEQMDSFVAASAWEPSEITPGPDGSNPFSYPILVQPVLDRHCVECHKAEKPEGNVILTGEPEGTFTKSYNVLIPHVAYTAWGMPNNNYEPLTEPDRFGARASRLVKLLDDGHYDVILSAEEWNRLVTWIDANALFYGTFDPRDQARQQRGERIAGPALE